ELSALVVQEHRFLAAVDLRGESDRVAADDGDVVPAVEIVVEESRAPTDVATADRRNAAGKCIENELRRQTRRRISIQRRQLVLVVRDEDGRARSAIVVGGIDTHA